MKGPRGIVWCPHCSQPHNLTDRMCPRTGNPIEGTLHRSADEHHPLLGTVLDGKYRVQRILGRGGLGIVFEGENLALRRPVAIKIVWNLEHADAVARLRREAQIIASLQHPNICDVYDVGDVPRYGPYLITERLRGETIASRFRWQRALEIGETLGIIAQVLSGLHAAHAQGIIHRDIKPANVFIAPRLGCPPLAKILDFGLAKDLHTPWATALTRPGKTPGTPQYMAPEQLTGARVSGATDLFAVGVLAYEMLTGQHPFAAGTTAEIQRRVLDDAPTRPRRLRPRIPPAVEAVVLRALAKRPAKRFADALAMQRALSPGALPSLATDEEAAPSSCS